MPELFNVRAGHAENREPDEYETCVVYQLMNFCNLCIVKWVPLSVVWQHTPTIQLYEVL